MFKTPEKADSFKQQLYGVLIFSNLLTYMISLCSKKTSYKPIKKGGQNMESQTVKSMTFNILAKKEGGEWVAHCLELDIVATAKNIETLKKDIVSLIAAQVDYAFSHDNLDNLYHPAPPDVWKMFFECKSQVEEKIKLESKFQKDRPLKTFVPPWIIAKTCLVEDSYFV